MSHSDPRQRPSADAAPGDAPPAPAARRALPEFPQHAAPVATAHSPIEREIERSQRASAALAATRALARASFTDSQLAAEAEAAAGEAGGDGDVDGANWVRTEYASLDQSVRTPQDDVPHGGVARNLVGGGFHPGLAFQDVRAFPGPSIAQVPIRTRSGAQARFLQESRQTPRAERSPGATPRNEHSLSNGAGLYDKPAVIPMRATPGASPVVRPVAGVAVQAGGARASSGEPFKLALAVGLGAVIALIGGGVAWKSGRLSHREAGAVPLAGAQPATKAEAAQVAPMPSGAITLPAPAAGTSFGRTDAEVDAALAAAARAADVPRASVQAAGPALVARPLPAAPAAVAVAPRAGVAPAAVATPAPARPTTPGKDAVAAAIAQAQARADSFLANGSTPSAAAAHEASKED